MMPDTMLDQLTYQDEDLGINLPSYFFHEYSSEGIDNDDPLFILTLLVISIFFLKSIIQKHIEINTNSLIM